MAFLWVDEQELRAMFESRIQTTQNNIIEQIKQVDAASRQSLGQEIRQLDLSTKLKQLDATFHTRIQVMEQAFLEEIRQVKTLLGTKADQEKLDQLSTSLLNKVQASTKTVIEEVKKADTHSEIVKTHTELLQRIYQAEQFLSKEVQLLHVHPEIVQLLGKVVSLQEEIQVISEGVSTLLPTHPASEEKPIHDLIRDQIKIATDALAELGHQQTEWFNNHFTSIQETKQEEEQAHQAQQKRLNVLASHIIPTGEAS